MYQNFANALHNLLPRELRDQIYGYLFCDGPGENFSKLLESQVRAAEMAGCVNLCNANFPLPPFADPEIVGHDMATEVLEAVYSRVFRTCGIHPSNIEVFLRPKLPALDLSPAHFIRKVEIEWENRNAGSDLLRTRDIPEDALRTFDLLPHDRGVIIDNIIRCAMIEGVESVGAFIEKFRRVYEHLQLRGIDMRFVGREKAEPFKYFTAPDEWVDQYEAIKLQEQEEVAEFLKELG